MFDMQTLMLISIHALHEESDAPAMDAGQAVAEFQSTLSMRRATVPQWSRLTVCPLISIHALHEESDEGRPTGRQPERISIHALHEESDKQARHVEPQRHISIHALHEESDIAESNVPSVTLRFQSTLSMRRATMAGNSRSALRLNLFQSTLSMRRATSTPVARSRQRP